MRVIGTVYTPGEVLGDFAAMLQAPGWEDALFVFNDNEEQFRAFLAGEPAGCAAGGGNAAIRPYRCQDPPRAAGIPTGAGGRGYAALTEAVRATLDAALAVVAELVASGRYRRLYYSAADAGGALGTGTFEVADDVKRHIVAGLRALDDGA